MFFNVRTNNKTSCYGLLIKDKYATLSDEAMLLTTCAKNLYLTRPYVEAY